MSALVWWLVVSAAFVLGWIGGARIADHRCRKWALRLVNQDRLVNHPETGNWHPVCEFGPTWHGQTIAGIGTQPIQGPNISYRFARADGKRFSLDGWVVVLNVPELGWWGKQLHGSGASRDDAAIEDCAFVIADTTALIECLE